MKFFVNWDQALLWREMRMRNVKQEWKNGNKHVPMKSVISLSLALILYLSWKTQASSKERMSGNWPGNCLETDQSIKLEKGLYIANKAQAAILG